MMQSLLIANRGAIARRIIRTCRRLGVRTIAVYTAADAGAPFVREADHAILLTSATALGAYLDRAQIIAAARSAGADAIHPGYGFLSENAEFAQACCDACVTFVGPTPAAMRAMGNKQNARLALETLGVPGVPWMQIDAAKFSDDVIAGSDVSAKKNREVDARSCINPSSIDDVYARVDAIGFPILVKAAAGGGGKGMRRVDRREDLREAINGAAREARAAFGDATVMLEKYVVNPRHIEVQIIGDTHGTILHLGERECSAQRRHQKILEEAPSPVVTPELREQITAAALQVARSCNYTNAGTIEFLLDAANNFYFLEMNTRLQVEHAVTEMIYGVDLVEWQLRVASGEKLPRAQHELTPCGHAVEARLYAEDARAGFVPATGTLRALEFSHAPRIRVECGVAAGMAITIDFDPMLAKIIAWGEDRATALTRLTHALAQTTVDGVITNRDFLLALLRDPHTLAGAITTQSVEPFARAWYDASIAPRDPFSPWRPSRSDASWQIGIGSEHATDANVIGGGAQKFIEGNSHKSSTTSTRTRARKSAPDHGLTAPMPGRIVQIAVTEQQKISADDILIVMEAMKMEYTIRAPHDGVVRKIRCAVGALVERGAELIEVIACP